MPNPDFPLISNVFVLMLENHSFDHLLGFSGITGNDAETGKPTTLDGLTGNETNTYQGTVYKTQPGASFSMAADPGHEFSDTLLQLTGSKQTYNPANGYPAINNNGFVQDYAGGAPGGQPQDIMNCFSPEQLPVLNALAREFAVCDRWFSSLPGPTCPNRFFIHAGSSGGLDHSPDTAQILAWETISGMNFQHGTIFDQLRTKYDDGFRIYRDNKGFVTDIFPNVAQLRGINSIQTHSMTNFAADVTDPAYDSCYTFIEPSYGDVIGNTYKNGSSMHPMDDATHGEALIKTVYEAIRNSPHWPKSLLIIVWDEHGGFYDHVPPPAATAPADQVLHGSMNRFGFDFKQYGVRVPAVVISPLIPKNIIDHRIYDHTSVLKTLHGLFLTEPMTERDRNANSLEDLLLKLDAPRTDTPITLPNPASSDLLFAAAAADNLLLPANQGSLPLFLHAALRADLDTATNAEDENIIRAEFSRIRTRGDAEAYLQKVQRKINNQV
ncbi:alkaline phosphatase family protein [Mucilaginibacter sp. SP1R1]|uniref:alkaline phosphatase family protein n=1 Tax=Mucilaginibacter sp. SP1R1 TaxID=2723091 RepID=UPI00160FF2A8|nr:alkaline phosphatase family protein [Mucilaginibacter sp. SP1R1]MBB6148567.1 phospholipase C [Mucilaginibacter sp. SP1R1]